MISLEKIFSRRSSRGRASRPTNGARPRLEALESRVVLYTATGNAWPVPQVITISFVPDGTNLGGVASNLNAVFNSKPQLAGRWQAQILKAAQAWAQQTNINFVVVPDNGTPIGQGAYQQGDPGFGDIRIGGFDFGSSTLAMAVQPPPINNFSIAGDMYFNTAQNFNINTTFDIYTMAVHEFGHALGLGHSNASGPVAMNPLYGGVKPYLSTDDAAGIRSIYSGGNPRSPDAFDAAGPNDTFAAASDLNAWIDPATTTALVTNLDLTTLVNPYQSMNYVDTDFYKFNAPVGTTGALTLNVQSAGLSLLSPLVTVYAADQKTVLGSASGANQYGTTLSVTVNGVYAGEQFYVKVQGADPIIPPYNVGAFDSGAYAMTLNFGNGPSPTVPLVNTQVPDGNPISGGGGIALSTRGHAHGRLSDGRSDAFPSGVAIPAGHQDFPHGPAIFKGIQHRRDRHRHHRSA